MNYEHKTISHDRIIIVPFDKEMFDQVLKNRWNIYDERPVKAVGELCYLMRRVVNSDLSRLATVEDIVEKHNKVIIFYNFDYELKMLKLLTSLLEIKTAEWNGHAHEEVPQGDRWMYLVQYAAGAEGWNCIKTDTIIFFSQNYSYKTMVQAAGRIDRLNTPFRDLYYYHIRSDSPIDVAITRSLKQKKNFNMRSFIKE
jgi:superfamily II DNA or RNA helicase